MRLLKAYALTAIVGTQTAQGKISSIAGSSLDTTFGRELVHIKVPL